MLKNWREKRILVDTAGYGLLIAAALTGWLPGPGGVPLALAGLSLLSIHNKWAMDLREYVLKHGGEILKVIFPKNPVAQWAYDIVAATLLVVAGFLAWRHAAVWQVTVAASAFFLAVFVALMNRDRIASLKKSRG